MGDSRDQMAPTYLWAGFPRGTGQTSLPWEALRRREAKSRVRRCGAGSGAGSGVRKGETGLEVGRVGLGAG